MFNKDKNSFVHTLRYIIAVNGYDGLSFNYKPIVKFLLKADVLPMVLYVLVNYFIEFTIINCSKHGRGVDYFDMFENQHEILQLINDKGVDCSDMKTLKASACQFHKVQGECLNDWLKNNDL